MNSRRRPRPTPGDEPAFEVREPAQPSFVRSPVSAVRALVFAAIAIAAATRVSATRVAHFRSSMDTVLAEAPHWSVTGVVATLQLSILLVTGLGFVGLLLGRSWTRLGRVLVTAACTVGALFAISHLVGSDALVLGPRGPGTGPPAPGSFRPGEYGLGSVFPTGMDVGIVAAAVLIDAEHWSSLRRRWRLVPLAAVVVAHVGVWFAQPASVIVLVTTAGAVVQTVRLALGVRNTRPHARSVGARLVALGYDVRSVERFDAWREFTGFRVSTGEGPMFAKVLHRDSWASFLPIRLYRALRFRDVAEQGPFRSLRSAVEHEALCSLKAYSDGVPTARLSTMTTLDGGAFLLAFDAGVYSPLDTLAPERRSAELTARLWDAVAQLQRSRIVHRRLNGSSVLVDADGAPLVVEFGDASLGVVGPELATDVAEMLAVTAVDIGADPAVTAAVDALGPAAVAAALPRLQPLALTRRTRDRVRRTTTLDDLRLEIERRTGVSDVPIAELQRVTPRTLVTIAALAFAAWSLVPQLLGSTAVWSPLGSANWWWGAAALGLSLVTYVGAALCNSGSVSERLPAVRNVAVQFATSFVALVAPGGALAVSVRFLRKRGVSPEVAAGAVSLNTVAGGVVHLTLTVVFLSIAGTSGLEAFNLPSLGVIALVVAGIVALAGLGALVPWTRAMAVTHVWPAIRRSATGIGDVLREPRKVAELVGGSAMVTLGYIAALAVSVAAFGPGPSFVSVALVYLVANAISAVAPTPGGIGAVEATLIAGLTSAGMASATAVAAVLLFRVATFWVPLLPGYAAFVVLQRTGDL